MTNQEIRAIQMCNKDIERLQKELEGLNNSIKEIGQIKKKNKKSNLVIFHADLRVHVLDDAVINLSIHKIGELLEHALFEKKVQLENIKLSDYMEN
ncbi:hypothetical protein MASR1M45_12260 [Candidatus Kapaibacterium sp.]